MERAAPSEGFRTAQGRCWKPGRRKKFCPTTLQATKFFARWKNLGVVVLFVAATLSAWGGISSRRPIFLSASRLSRVVQLVIWHQLDLTIPSKGLSPSLILLDLDVFTISLELLNIGGANAMMATLKRSLETYTKLGMQDVTLPAGTEVYLTGETHPRSWAISDLGQDPYQIILVMNQRYLVNASDLDLAIDK